MDREKLKGYVTTVYGESDNNRNWYISVNIKWNPIYLLNAKAHLSSLDRARIISTEKKDWRMADELQGYVNTSFLFFLAESMEPVSD